MIRASISGCMGCRTVPCMVLQMHQQWVSMGSFLAGLHTPGGTSCDPMVLSREREGNGYH
jgi:hypothetical protein